MTLSSGDFELGSLSIYIDRKKARIRNLQFSRTFCPFWLKRELIEATFKELESMTLTEVDIVIGEKDSDITALIEAMDVQGITVASGRTTEIRFDPERLRFRERTFRQIQTSFFLDYFGLDPFFPLGSFSEKEWQALIKSCITQHLGPVLYKHILNRNILDAIPKTAAQELLREYQASLQNVIRYQQLCDEFLLRMKPLQIPFSLIEDFAIAHLYYEEPAFRVVRSLDILIDPMFSSQIHEVLNSLNMTLQANHPLLSVYSKEISGKTVYLNIHTGFWHIDIHNLDHQVWEFEGKPFMSLATEDAFLHRLAHDSLNTETKSELLKAFDIVCMTLHEARGLDANKITRKILTGLWKTEAKKCLQLILGAQDTAASPQLAGPISQIDQTKYKMWLNLAKSTKPWAKALARFWGARGNQAKWRALKIYPAGN